MLDHVFTDAISALRDAFEAAFLERQAFDEHFQVDVLLGDLVVGDELRPARRGTAAAGRRPRHVRLAALEPDRVPAAGTSTRCSSGSRRSRWRSCFRVQRLVEQPDPAVVHADDCPTTSPLIGDERLERAGLTVEIGHLDPAEESGRRPAEYAIEVTYEGLYELAEETLADGASTLLDEHFGALGGWIAATLVRLGDLRLAFRPADDGTVD